MDILAHSLWTNIAYEMIVRKKKLHGSSVHRNRWFAIWFGVAPDFFAFFLPFFTSVFGNGTLGQYARSRVRATWLSDIPKSFAFPPDVSSLSLVPPYVFDLYNISHSFLIFLCVFCMVWLVRRRPYWPLGAWGLHIAVDVWSHNEVFFPTPILYPLSYFRVSGVSWAEPSFMLVNYTLLILSYLLLFVVWRRKQLGQT